MKNFLLAVVMLSSSLSIAQDFWQQTTGPNGGVIRSLAINSTGHVFAGTSGGGVFRSTNNGASWSRNQ